MEERMIILFGAGAYGKKALHFYGRGRVRCFVDNNSKLWYTFIEDKEILPLEDAIERYKDCILLIAVAPIKEKEIVKQLEQYENIEYRKLSDLRAEEIVRRIKGRPDYLGTYKRCIEWIKNNTINGHAITVTNNKKTGYPEVSGYYIPSLLRFGFRKLASSYAKWLCKIQNEDGSWNGASGSMPYVFDTGQILKGLLAIRRILPEVDDNIIAGCNYLISNVEDSGRMHKAGGGSWYTNIPGSSELIHLYCIEPLYDAAEIFQNAEYRRTANRIKDYYVSNYRKEILSFTLLSHYYAYVIEALVDVGEIELAKEAMDRVSLLQRKSGAIPAKCDVNWICSTGLFQFAIIWFKLGDITRGEKALEYGCRLQNESGGWFGSYPEENGDDCENDYIPFDEISWANKFFLDALYYKNKLEFNLRSDSFKDTTKDGQDGRYKCVYYTIKDARDKNSTGLFRVADIGCGKGFFLNNLLREFPNILFTGVDVSEKVLSYINDPRIEIKQGCLTMIPEDDDYFDVTFACESLEHAIDIENAITEMARVTKPGGRMVIIDKNAEKLGEMIIEDWEQWLDVDGVKGVMLRYCSEVSVNHDIHHGDRGADGLFVSLVGIIK